ncbi:hypothetical protein RBI21_01920 [Klebsiella pneumoniae]|nr:hypothetical protein RBI21_01920 [Klebsiella pneumoniae]
MVVSQTPGADGATITTTVPNSLEQLCRELLVAGPDVTDGEFAGEETGSGMADGRADRLRLNGNAFFFFFFFFFAMPGPR